MGLIKAIAGAVGSTMGDQWKEYFYCEALPTNILAAKGKKKVSSRSSNTNGSDNVISSGSIVCVADGQCMLIVEQGKVVEVCAEPGEFTYDASTEPSIFAGKLGEGILNVFKTVGKRFTFGGETPKDQRVYYFNTKELVGNKYGTPSPVPFRVVDERVGLDLDIGIRCFGEYSYKLVNPLLFYTNVCGNVSSTYDRSQLDSQLKTELLTALQPVFAKISEMGIRYSALPGHTTEMAELLKTQLSSKWTEYRGIEIVQFGVSSVKANEEDEERLKQMQLAATLGGGNIAMGYSVAATGESMRAAASNEAGALNAFMGMGAANMMGGNMVGTTAQAGMMQQQVAAQQPVQQVQQAAVVAAQPTADSWTCACGNVNTGKFCAECGQPRA